MNNNYKFSLDKSSKKYPCPACGRKTFVLYINNETGNPLHDTVGMCDRANNCAHHYPPKQYFSDNNIHFDKKKEYTLYQKPIHKPKPQPSYIDENVFKQSLQGYENNNLIQYLYNNYCVEDVNDAISRYFIGTSKHWNGAIIFWQIDIEGKIRAGKIMLYDITTGKRIKKPYNKIQWVHEILKLPKPTQCFFGEHLLRGNNKPIAIVESEKTAIIASIYAPKFIWLASGGSKGLNIEKCQCLHGRNVVLYPDAGMFQEWSEKAKELSKTCKITVFDWIEKNATERHCLKIHRNRLEF